MTPDSENGPHPRPAIGLRARILLCALMVAAGGAALAVIFTTEPVAERETAVRETAMLVTVTEPESGSFRPVVAAMGTVRAEQEITLSPRVSGQISEISEHFVPGGFVRKGEMLVRIDEADYRTALQQRESELHQAIADLEIEQGRQVLAEQDYRDLQRDLPANRKALVLREPHLRAAQARIESAEAAVERARLDLQRTEIVAPFDAQVLSREANLGSQVAAGDPLARLAGVDTYWVETTLPLDQLRWLTFADNDGGSGSPVTVRHRTAWPDGAVRQGRLYRLIGELEGDTRLARALVAVEDPLGLQDGSRGLPQLIIGAFVECRIEGGEISGALRVQRDHVRSNDTVWLMRDGALAIEPVDIVFRDERHAYIRGGLDRRDRIVTSSLATVQPGALLRVRTETALDEGAAQAAGASMP